EASSRRRWYFDPVPRRNRHELLKLRHRRRRGRGERILDRRPRLLDETLQTSGCVEHERPRRPPSGRPMAVQASFRQEHDGARPRRERAAVEHELELALENLKTLVLLMMDVMRRCELG